MRWLLASYKPGEGWTVLLFASKVEALNFSAKLLGDWYVAYIHESKERK